MMQQRGRSTATPQRALRRVEPEFERDWPVVRGESPLTWDQARHAARDALNGQTSLLHAPIRAIQKAPADSHAHGARSRAKPRCLHRRALENAASNRTPSMFLPPNQVRSAGLTSRRRAIASPAWQIAETAEADFGIRTTRTRISRR
jgi:hypothetical protein